MELTNKQMKKIDGGANWGLISGIAAAIVFVVGLVSGYTNPSKCSN